MLNEKQLLEAVRSDRTPEQILEAALGLNNVTSGSEVTVVSDPSYPYEGIKGRVNSIKDGYAKVTFPNGNQVDLAVNQLIPV